MLSSVTVAALALLGRSANALAQAAPAPPSASTSSTIDFERSIRPLFAAHCVSCHGERKQAGGLRLDRRADALAGARGGTQAVLVPGRPQESELLARVLATDDDERMPQKAPALAAQEIEALRAWIAAGAPWPEDGSRVTRHWSYAPLQAPPVPHVKSTARCRNPIDRFVLARLEREGLDFAPEADAATLVRRVSLDLAGLPPAVDEVAAFEQESRTDRHGAYERALARLLASSAYAEKQAQHWLDLARYADTNGYEKDERRSMWPWRDWVIHAFEKDMGFDRFTLEQLAGDLLPNATLEQRIATGFQRNTLVNQEGGTDPEEFRDAAVIDRTNTLGSVWLGSTIACAQCHDHKYDPFTQRDYFQLYAFFDQTTDTGNKLDPVLSLPTKEQELALAELEKRRAELAARRKLAEAETRDALRARLAREEQHDWFRWHLGELPDVNGANVGGSMDGAAIAAELPQRGAKLAIPFDRPSVDRSMDVRGIRIEASTYEDTPPMSKDSPRLTRVVARLCSGPANSGLQASDRGNLVPLSRGTVDGARRSANATVEGDANGSVTLEWGLDAERGATTIEVLYELASPLHVATGSGWTLELELGTTPIRGLHLRAWTTSSPTTLDDAFAVRAGAWELAQPIAVDSTEAGLKAKLGLEPGGERATTWTRRDDLRDGAPIPLDGERFAHFARRKLALRMPRTLEFSLGGDDGFRAWVDGREIASNLTWPGFLERQVRTDVALGVGEHELLVEVVNSSGPGALWCEIVEPAREHVPTAVRDAFAEHPIVPQPQQTGLVAAYSKALVDEELRTFAAEEKALATDEERLRAQIATTLVMEERREPRVTHIHQKGSYLSPGDVVSPDVPAFLPPLPAGAPRNRLGLAQWLTSPENPLTARVFVNRMWERFFGRGIVATSDDFGTRGDAPTHPELLDWLAHDFVEHGWSVKHLCETIVTSTTYRQSSNWTRELLERDADNHLLARQSRPRMEVETLRDVALATSGLLATEIGGPSVMPPQPDGVWAPVYSNDRWETADGPARHRRGLYTFWRRSSPYATFQLFDAPSREQTCTRRARTNTPLQALALLNDPAFVECADALAKRIEAQPGDTNERVAWAWRAVTSRTAQPAEIAALAKLFDAESASAKPSSAPQAADATHRAWTRVASVLLNLDEVLTRP